MDSEDEKQTVFNTIFKSINSEVEKPDEFLDCKPSLTNFSQNFFSKTLPLVESSTCTSSHTDDSHILSPLSNSARNDPRPITNDQLEHDLEAFITH